MHFDCASQGLVLLAHGARFLSYVHFVWQTWLFRDILKSDRRRTMGTFSSTWQAWHFLDVAKTLAGVGQNESCFWRSFFVAGAVLGELGRHFERVESLVFWNCCHF